MLYLPVSQQFSVYIYFVALLCIWCHLCVSNFIYVLIWYPDSSDKGGVYHSSMLVNKGNEVGSEELVEEGKSANMHRNLCSVHIVYHLFWYASLSSDEAEGEEEDDINKNLNEVAYCTKRKLSGIMPYIFFVFIVSIDWK
jgi:hypothetical protein